jgi:hypothetical protein
LWTEIFMLKTALAGVLVLGAIGPSLVSAEERFESKLELGSAAQDRMVLTRAQIGHVKAALRLTREQEQYWLPVEAALRDLTGRGVHGVTVAARPAVLDQAKLQRLVSAAMPLLMTLDDGQKRHAAALARSMGLGPLMHRDADGTAKLIGGVRY